jgi:hypothetical protein
MSTSKSKKGSKSSKGKD